ncbi:hypothetical protein E1B28_004230 [Marasmius oreades]|uniref:Uncharacterized protein n=1 Tax=Marasmius oreades TaxID=181124 RepID=A0A9P8ACB4_9AGAR|nr:uncharacterized protein E1B28_004230 [Marasmius oreades]KAG7096821.1 hypothetical protein E1B28_004230 [Marasmius oreades]
MAQDFTTNSWPLDSHEGQVGAIYEKERVFVTMPNAEVIFDPLRGVRSVHLRKNNHFGLEDPLYFPQPFSLAHPHLAFIPLPSTDHAGIFFLCWCLPTHNDFEWVNPEDESGSSTGLGRFKKDLLVKLHDTVSRLNNHLARMDTSHSCLTQDKYMKNYDCSLPWLLAQLNCPCSFTRALRTFGLIQRICLECDGRAEWLVNYAHRWEHSGIIQTGLEPAHIVGALAGNLELTQRLFNLGTT